MKLVHRHRCGTRLGVFLAILGMVFVHSVGIESAFAASTINVPGNFSTIQAAITAATNGDTIVVAPGTYFEHIDFLGKNIEVRSAQGPSVTIIDGSSSDTVVKFVTGEGAASVLRGFTIQHGSGSTFGVGGVQIANGASPTIVANSVVNNAGSFISGAIDVASGTPTIVGNSITDNTGCQGVGISIRGGSSPVIRDNVIARNVQSFCSGGSGGGGILLGGSISALIERNTIEANEIGSYAGGISINGGVTPTIRDNVIRNNIGGSTGGGISGVNNVSALIANNLIVGNKASAGSGAYFSTSGGSTVLVNNTFDGNSGGFGNITESVATNGGMNGFQFFNNIITGGVTCSNPLAFLPSFHSNNVGAFSGSCASAAGTNNNISSAPLFTNTATNNYRLQAGSPSIDAGDNAAPNLPTTDIDGNARISNSIVDQGAYEFSTSSAGLAFVDGEPGDEVSAGQQLSFTSVTPGLRDSAACTSPPCNDIVSFHVNGSGHDFQILFAAPIGQALGIGTFPNAVRADYRSGSQPGLEVRGDLRECGTLTGGFIVDTATFDGSGNALTFAARFEQHCSGGEPALFGAVSFNALTPYRTRSLSTNALTFGDTHVGTVSPSQQVTVTNNGPSSLAMGAASVQGSDASSFQLSGGSTCFGATLSSGQSCTFDLTFGPTPSGGDSHSAKLTFFDDLAPVGGTGRDIALTGTAVSAIGEFTPVTPFRVLDTRNGTGGTLGPVGAGQSLSLDVTGGPSGVPITGVSAVVMNVTATNTTAAKGFVTVYPDDPGPAPNASNLNFTAGKTVPNLVTVKVGGSGNVRLLNGGGKAQLIADIVGYYADNAATTAGSRFHGTDPTRILDTRGFTGGHFGKVGPKGVAKLQVLGAGPVPSNPNVSAVAMNVTVTGPTANSFLTIYPDDVARPNASNKNYVAGHTVTNLLIMTVTTHGFVDFYNNAGSTHVIADVVGYYDNDYSTEAGRFIPIAPTRAIDTRDPAIGALGPGDELGLQLADLPADAVGAVLMNVTATGPTARGFITAYPWDIFAIPNASNLNFVPGLTVPNLVMVKLSSTAAFGLPAGSVGFFNGAGFTNLIVDVGGFFTDSTATLTSTSLRASSHAATGASARAHVTKHARH